MCVFKELLSLFWCLIVRGSNKRCVQSVLPYAVNTKPTLQNQFSLFLHKLLIKCDRENSDVKTPKRSVYPLLFV